MKNILFATTALVATAGIASAEVTGSGPGSINIRGMGEIGVFDNGNDNTQFFTDVDVTFTMTGTADNGLTFGAAVDLDENEAAFGNDNTDDGGATFFVAYGSARLTMGDTDGALDAAVPEMNLAGSSIADDQTTHGAFMHHDGVDGDGDNQVATFSYGFSGVTAYLSAEQENDGAASIAPVGAGETIWGIGVAYTGDLGGTAITAGIGYQKQDDFVATSAVGVTATLASGLVLGANYTEMDDLTAADVDSNAWNIGIGYTMNALAIGFNYGEVTVDGANNDTTGYGLAVSYDLGGGLSAQMGYGNTDPEVGASTDTWSLGLAMSF